MKTIGILAHVDAGKTTVSEQILYQTGAKRAPGRVDDGNTLLDTDEIEKNRGITIYLGIAPFSYQEEQYTLLDTPGHADFSAEKERAIAVMDAAIVVVSAVEGVQAQTEAVYELLREKSVPILFFVNKMDREGADLDGVLSELRTRLRAPAEYYCKEERLAEFLAERDEALLEEYLSKGEIDIGTSAKKLFLDGRYMPILQGTALKGDGISSLLDALFELTEQKKTEEREIIPFRVRYDEKGTRLTFLRVLGGGIAAKEMVSGEKINEIRIYNGEKFQTVQKAENGTICAVTGLSVPITAKGKMRPLFSVAVQTNAEIEKVRHALAVLEAEDPMLSVSYRADLGQFFVAVFGAVQLEILEEVLAKRFGMAVTFGKGRPLYLETISEPVTGYGHFEPLRHYAEVHLKLSPAKRGSGITFESTVSGDVLPQQYQNLIRTHIFDKTHKGVLTGSPITDIKITLLAGRAHEKHTEGGDFREATWRAVRQGLMGAQSVLLEPYVSFEISCDAVYAGKVLGALQENGCIFAPVEAGEAKFAVKGRGAAIKLSEYASKFASQTAGTGRMRTKPDGYEPVKNQEEIASEIAYDSEHDTENTAVSIFCSHGAGYPVAWKEVPQYIHIK